MHYWLTWRRLYCVNVLNPQAGVILPLLYPHSHINHIEEVKVTIRKKHHDGKTGSSPFKSSQSSTVD